MAKEKTILPRLKLELKTANVTLLCGLVVLSRMWLEVSNGKPVNMKLSISSDVNLLPSYNNNNNNSSLTLVADNITE